MSRPTSQPASTHPNAGLVYILRRTLPWMRFATLAGLVLAAVMISFAVDAAAGGFSSRQFDSLPFVLLYVVFAAVFLIPALYLRRYDKRIMLFAAQEHLVHLESALEAQRKFWKAAGILTIVALCGVVLAVVLLLH